eukprot:COSAG02_NODE_1283_length_13471_cov_12.121223_13_plen_46_part_00
MVHYLILGVVGAATGSVNVMINSSKHVAGRNHAMLIYAWLRFATP